MSFLSLVTLAIELDLQSRLSEGPNKSSVWVWRKSIQRFPRYFMHNLECGLMPNVMAALPNIDSTLCESSVIPFLVPRRKVWLMPAAGVPCSNAANIWERKIFKVNFALGKILSGGKSPQKCIYTYCSSPGDGQISYKVWLASGDRRRCSKEGKTQNPLKFAGVPQTRLQISAVNGPKFAILWGHVEDILLFNKFFPVVDACLTTLWRYSLTLSPTKLCDGAQMAIFCVLYFQRAPCSTFQTCILKLR